MILTGRPRRSVRLGAVATALLVFVMLAHAEQPQETSSQSQTQAIGPAAGVSPVDPLTSGKREKSATRAAKPAKQPHSLREFSEHVMKYAKLRQRLASKLPKLPEKATPEQMAAHRKALADLIRMERAGAKQGDILETDSGLLLVRTIQQHLDGPEGAEMKAAIRDQAPRSVSLRVNDPYPDDAPKSLTPPGLLQQLPQLPKEVEYRFVDRHLILLDVEAGLIVDYTRDALH